MHDLRIYLIEKLNRDVQELQRIMFFKANDTLPDIVWGETNSLEHVSRILASIINILIAKDIKYAELTL